MAHHPPSYGSERRKRKRKGRRKRQKMSEKRREKRQVRKGNKERSGAKENEERKGNEDRSIMRRGETSRGVMDRMKGLRKGEDERDEYREWRREREWNEKQGKVMRKGTGSVKKDEKRGK